MGAAFDAGGGVGAFVAVGVAAAVGVGGTVGISLCAMAVGLDCDECVEGNVKNRRLEVIPNRTTSNPRAMAQTSLGLLSGGTCLTKLSPYIGATILATLAVESARKVSPVPAVEFTMGVRGGVWTLPDWNTLDAWRAEPSSSA